ncbi:ras-responsive element-binding protein 1 isoform X2 [Echeneis naucrates]|uniref:ras-responsive element-binding protein 1 isoform X2 n=1 Tax=Echeneis naucrates TaxID=173247 RepID=UPI001114218E|nr:ras-responsive element-binding protein 1-like isoform X2 [Echeneis naucrates]
MSSIKQRYRDISPVTLQVVGGTVSSSLYCEEVEGLPGGSGALVESFLVELYRCKLCQFTCVLKTSISSHLLLRHRPPALTCLEEAEEGGREEAELQRGSSPYRLSKQSDEDEEFLFYNMLDNMSPSTCDISTAGGLQVAHTCEVSTLFEEEGEDSSIFPLKGGSVDLSCPVDPPTTQEEMAQSAHLMTLGLCRISAPRPQPRLPPPPHISSQPSHQPSQPADSLGLPQTAGLKPNRTETQINVSPSRRRLLCFLCPVTLSSRRLLDIHIRSHRAAGGFSCVRCSWTVDSWDELELHWRGHCRRRKKRRKRQEEKEKKKNAAQQNDHHQMHQYATPSDAWRDLPMGQVRGKEVGHTDSQTCQPQTAPSVSATLKKENNRRNRNRRKTKEKKKPVQTTAETTGKTGLCCSLCHSKFSSKLTLRRHLGVHRGDKPFTCPHCHYSSRLKASLLQHLRTHTVICCISFSIQKKSLDLHARRHHTGEVFPCQQCKYSSPDRQLLLRHVRRHHATDGAL